MNPGLQTHRLSLLKFWHLGKSISLIKTSHFFPLCCQYPQSPQGCSTDWAYSEGQMVITENSPTDPVKGCRLEVSGGNGFSMRKYVISLTNYWNVKLLQFCTREHPGVSFPNVFMLLPIVIISMLMKEMFPQIPREY